VFSPDGALVAKYYKHALFGASTNFYDPNDINLAQTTPELSEHFGGEGIFETTFGIKFATLICNDINDRSLLESIKDNGITDIIYGNTYENMMSKETIGTTLTAASYLYGFNFVAASTGFYAASGSGVYSDGQLLTNQSDNTALKCTFNLGNVPPTDDKEDCVSVRSAVVNKRTTEKSSIVGNSFTKTAPTDTWDPNFTGYSLALPAPGVWFSYPINIQNEFTFDRGSTFKLSSQAYKFFDAINQVGTTSFFTPPTEPGIYEARVSFNGIECSAILDFAEGTPEGTGNTQYAFAAYSGDAIFPSTACPDSVSYCSLSRCLKFQEGTGACITVPEMGGAPAPLKSEIAQSITVSGTFANSTFPMALVSDSDLQPVDMSDLTLSGSFKFEDFEKNKEGTYVTDNVVHAVETDGNNAFVTLVGTKQFSVPSGCNVCSNAYDLFDFEDARVPVSEVALRDTICSYYKTKPLLVSGE